MKNKIIFIVIAMSINFVSCWSPKSIVTTANITQPVLVGKVKTIGGGPVENSSLKNISSFSSAIQNSDYYWSTGYTYGSTTSREGSNKIDEQLLPIIDQQSDSPSVIIVDSLRFKAVSGYWLFVMSSATKGSIKGAKYSK